MSEAFWDPTKLTNLSFSEDPVPNLHRYTENFRGQTIAPTFGGNTANTEFEALTSYSMSLLMPVLYRISKLFQVRKKFHLLQVS